MVPCYNEGIRLDEDAFLSLACDDVRLLFVDDGSHDNTRERLSCLAARDPQRIAILTLRRNRGKGEAVRAGLRQALAEGAKVVGYVDADLSTPIPEIRRLLRVLLGGNQSVLLGSRVALLGRNVTRRASRHYIGRVLASAASLVLQIPVYDTQCGAKLFRASAALESALAEPFLSRWVFDVELLGRMLIGTPQTPGLPVSRFAEEPLHVWHGIAGSKVRPWDITFAAADLARIAVDMAVRRHRVRRKDTIRGESRS